MMAKLFDFKAISWEEPGYLMKISINIGQMRYCCSISMKIWGNQYPEIFSVRRTTPDFDLMKVNHEDSGDDITEGLQPSKNLLWGEVHQKFGESSSTPATLPATTAHKIITIRGRREKRKRRKVKKNLWIPSKSEPSVQELDADNDKKIFNPLDDDWKSIFRSTTMMPVIDFSVTETTKPREETTELIEKRRNQQVDKNTGFLKRLVSKYCKIENTLGILQLCNSKSLSKRRKIRKHDLVLQNNKQRYLNQNKERKQQDFNLLNTVSNVFSLILPSRR